MVRERKVEEGITYLRCRCPFHNGQWLREDQFSPQYRLLVDGSRKMYPASKCKRWLSHARTARKRPDLPVHGRVPLDTVKPWLWEVYRHCGSWRGAAKTLDVSYESVMNWLRRRKRYDNQQFHDTMLKSSAQKIFATVRALRDGTIEPVTNFRTPRQSRYGCSQCGWDLDLHNPDCDRCEQRASEQRLDAERRAQRQREEEEAWTAAMDRTEKAA